MMIPVIRSRWIVKEMLPLLSDEELDYVYALYKDKYKGTMRKQ